METKQYVTYEAFGAVGDGKTDDLPAIATAHAYANEHGLPVRAKDDATYYIGSKAIVVTVGTDVDFGKAHFIIDDTEIEDRTKPIFLIPRTKKEFTPEISSLKKGQKKIDFPHEGTVYVRVYNDNKMIYIREGVNQNAGTAQNDTFLVDAEGNILTDIDWDYDTVTRAVAYSVDETPITLRGGIFTTIANRWKLEYAYHLRAFRITRAHVTMENITHYITGEGETGAPYDGFISAIATYDVKVKNCLFTPHFTYWAKLPTGMSPMGSYELSANGVIAFQMIGVRQTIDIMDRRYWGLMGTNFCKDMLLDDCIVSRFDAHMGVTNAVIRNCTLGHMCLLLIGHGKCLVENTHALGSSLVNMRQDYGSFFDGELIVKNCTWTPSNNHPVVLGAYNSEEHNFGYECRMPHTFTVDGLTIEDENLGEEYTNLYILPEFDPTFSEDKPFRVVPTKRLILHNIHTKSGKKYEITKNPALYPDLVVEEK